ncbi:MAG: choice-of-anchor L domain-containing protein, partial [Chitinophagales bacterium]
MIRIILTFIYTTLFIVSTSTVYGQIYNMSDNSVTDPTGTLYDSGGPNGEYSFNEDFTFTVCPTGTCECLRLEFSSLEIDDNFFDFLHIHNGNSTDAPLLFSLGGFGTPVDIYLDSGCATFHFISDTGFFPGWELSWSCVASCPATETINTSTSAYTTTELVEDLFLAGSCIEVSNITFTGDNQTIGSFSEGSSIGIEEGFVLSSGFLSSIPGTNDVSDVSDELFTPGDADLDVIIASTGQVTADAAILEFDFVPTTDEISFNYVFASDEYPEFVCSEYNDVFAFFISGDGFVGSENIALIPDSTTPVAINSVNNGTAGFWGLEGGCTSLSNFVYYNNNVGGSSFEFDGFTTVLTASASVTPCETYHIKIAIADVGDNLYDSAVFLEANSFAAGEGTTVTAVSNNSATSSNEMYEDCQGGYFFFFIVDVDGLSNPLTIDFVVTGTASAGIDYPPLPNSVVIPAGETNVQIDINAFADNLPEGAESIIVTSTSNFCVCDDGGAPPSELIILDNTSITTQLNAPDLCINDAVILSPNPNGGINPYSYQWSNNSTAPSISFNVDESNEGIYTVTVSDDCGNSASSTVNITFENPPPAVSIAAPGILCENGDPIVLTSSETDGIWSGAGITNSTTGIFDPNIATLGGSPYTVSYTLSNDCGTSSDDINIDLQSPPVVVIDGGGIICEVGGSVAIDFTFTTGTPPFEVAYTDGVDNFNETITGNTLTIDVTTTGTYEITSVEDALECTGTFSGTAAVEMSSLNIESAAVNHPVCSEANGSITDVVIQNAPLPLSFVWGDETGTVIHTGTVPSNVLQLEGVLAGTYTVTVTDGNDCTDALSFVLIDSPAPEINAASVNPSTCSGSNGGVSDVLIQGGTEPFLYEWQNQNGGTVGEDLFLDGVLAGNYTLIVTDVNGCTDEYTYTITDIPAPYLNGGTTSLALCGGENGAVTAVNVVGGTEPFQFQWINFSGDILGNEIDLEGVGLGDYTLIITDANGCTDEISFGVLQIPSPSLQLGVVTSATCGNENGAVEEVSIQGGIEPFAYEWRNASDSLIAVSSDLENVFSGTYTVMVTDANDCTASLEVEIGDTPIPEIIAGDVTPSSCGNDDGAINNVEVIGGTGDLIFDWQNASGEPLGGITDLNNLPQGNYTLIVTDENGCETTATFDIADLEAPILLGGEVKNATCSEANGSIEGITLEGGISPFTYEWQNGNGESINSGNYSPEILDLNNISAGVYTIIVTDFNGCAVSLQFNIEDAPSPQLTEGTPIETTCGEANGSIEGISIENGTAPFTFEWRNESGEIVGEELNINNLPTGSYDLQITDFNGCVDDIEVFVPEILPPQLQGGTVIPTTCSEANGSISEIELINGTAPFAYQWTNEQGEDIGETAMLENVLAGTYNLEVMDANDCLTNLQWTIDNQAAPQLEGGEIVPSSCGNSDGAIQNITVIGGTGELIFEWQNASGETLGNEQDLDEIPTGEYTLYITDQNGCVDELSFVTYDAVAPQLSEGVAVSSNCGESNGSITDISIEGGNAPYTYLWTNENGEEFGEEISLSNVPQGTYILTAMDAEGCTTTLSFEVTSTEAPQLLGGLVEPASCNEANGSIEGIEVVGENGIVLFTWFDSEDNEVGTGLNLENVLGGIYTLIATDEVGCTAELQFEVEGETAPQILEGLAENARCSEANGSISNVQIEGGTLPYVFTWTDAENNVYENTGTEANLLNIAAGNYTLVVTDANDCLANLDFEVLGAAGPTILGSVVNASICSEANGSIEGLEIEGETAPFGYEWRDLNGNLVGEEAVLSSVFAGIYTLHITDDNGCETTLLYEIADIPPPILSEGTVDLSSCGNNDGGVSSVKVEGGTAPYTYLWQDENGEALGEEVDLQNVTAGAYTLLVTDLNGCEVSLGFNVSDVGAPSISGGTANQTVCGSENGQVTGIEVNGGTGELAVRWTNSDGILLGENLEIFDLLAGEYTFTVEDEGGCIASQSFIIDDIPPPVILGATVIQASCGTSDGRISEVIVEAGTAPFTYEWRNVETNEFISDG